MRNFGYTNEEAEKLIAGYFKAYPGVKRFMDETYEELDKNGFVVYPEYGYIKRMDIRTWRSWKEKQMYMAARRSCQNALIQGLSAFIVKDAAVHIDKELRNRGLEAFVSFQVHDELGCLAPEQEAVEVFDVMRANMERDVMGVRLRVEGEVVRTMSKSAADIDLLDLAA